MILLLLSLQLVGIFLSYVSVNRPDLNSGTYNTGNNKLPVLIDLHSFVLRT
jgi:hypothetical protein